MCAQCNIWHAYQSSSYFHPKESTVHIESVVSQESSKWTMHQVSILSLFFPWLIRVLSSIHLFPGTHQSSLTHFSRRPGLSRLCPSQGRLLLQCKKGPYLEKDTFVLYPDFPLCSVVQFTRFGFNMKTTIRYNIRKKKVNFERSGRRSQWDSSIGKDFPYK
jgi:hypothetical protein